MFDPNLPELTRLARSLDRAGPERMQAFVARHRAFFILLAVLVAQLLLLSLQITRNHKVRLIQVWAVAIFDPFERSLRGLVDVTTKAWKNLRGLRQAYQQNQELQVQLVAARSRVHQLAQQAAEAERLRGLLEFKNRLPFQTVAAEVIATSPGESSNAVFIDKGTNDGLAADYAVITPQGIVGKIIAVFPRAAQVLLMTDHSSGVGCILEQTRVQGVLKGNGSTVARLHYIVNEESVSVGDTVITSGLDQIYPKGLPVGTVVQTGQGNIYKQVVVKPAVALDQLETVLVVLKPSSGQLQALTVPSRP